MTARRGSVRHSLIISASADRVWALVGAPERLHEWFPGITASPVEGQRRTITLGSGLTIEEQIITNDAVLRRFQYRVEGGLFVEHLATIDVFDLGDGRSLVSYATDAAPRTMALTIGGGTAGALDELKRRMEA